MKTPFIASVCLLALVLTSVAQSPPPVQSQPGAPGTSPAAQAPTNPGRRKSRCAHAVTGYERAPRAATCGCQERPKGQQPAVPGAPQGQQPAVPGASIPVTLSPAPGAATSPAAATATSPSPAVSPAAEAQPTGFLASNWLISKFHQGGPVMWPILIVSIIALTVGDRTMPLVDWPMVSDAIPNASRKCLLRSSREITLRPPGFLVDHATRSCE